jgi:hypothetical protein
MLVSRTGSCPFSFSLLIRFHPHLDDGEGVVGRGQLYIDGKLVGDVDISLTMPLAIGLAGRFVCGADAGSPVWDKHEPPFTFTGRIYGVTVDVSGDLIKDADAEVRMLLASYLTSRSLIDRAIRSNTGPYCSASPSGTIVAT